MINLLIYLAAGLVYVGLDQRSYSTLGPVSDQMGDRLWMQNQAQTSPQPEPTLCNE